MDIKSLLMVGRKPVAFVITKNNPSYLLSFDISDPENMILLDSFTDTDIEFASDIGIDKGTAFITGSTIKKLVAIDISDPSNMSKISTSAVTGGLNYGVSIDSARDLAFTRYDASSIIAWDISDPSSISQSGTIVTDGTNLDDTRYSVLNEAGTTLFVGLGTTTLTKIDVSDTSSMTVSTKASSGGGDSLALDETSGVLYGVREGADRLVSHDSSTLSLKDLIEDTGYFNGSSVVKVDTANDVVYVTCNTDDCLTSVDVSDPDNLTVLGKITSTALNGAVGLDLDLRNSVAYVSSIGSLVAIDISTPASMTILSSIANANIPSVSMVKILT